MILKDLIGKKKIAIAGRPRVGKTTLANKLSKELGIPKIIYTDDLIGEVSFEEAKKVLLELVKDEPRYIVEGVQVCRMLRQGMRDETWEPEIVVHVEATHRPLRKHKGLASLNDKALKEYMAMSPKAKLIKITNDIPLSIE